MIHMMVVKKGKSYETDEMIKNICGCLVKNQKQTPSSIAKCVDANPKTVQKYVKIARKLGIIKCEDIKMGEKNVQVCGINPKYREILKTLED
jgi:predicted transcriptional regulator